MQLAPLRYTKIEGTAVSVNVASADEAKAAIKELRQRKRELKFLRSGLAKQKKAARPVKRPRKAKAPKSGFEIFVDDMRWGLGAMLDQGKPSTPAARKPKLAEIEREMRELDQVIHNIDGCILQLEGRLLRHK
jgi:hypothetical protein